MYTQLNVKISEPRIEKKKKKKNSHVETGRNSFEFYVSNSRPNKFLIESATRIEREEPVRTYICTCNILDEKKEGVGRLVWNFSRVLPTENCPYCPVRRNSRSNTFELTRSSRIDF